MATSVEFCGAAVAVAPVQVLAPVAVVVPAALGPGFRFHPTDEELVKYYLERKATGRPLRCDCIAEIDLYKFDPWDLPGLSRLQTRDLEWYFFTALDRKYSHGSKTNRSTGHGYWKTTGKDNPIFHQTRIVGLKKALVYHSGRAPLGQRTNWVMHEYRLEDENLSHGSSQQDAFVLCRIFQKSGSGPKNGEQYGAPYIEEEWDDNSYAPAIPNNNIDEGNGQGVGFSDLQPTELSQTLTMDVAELPDVDSSLQLQNLEDTKTDRSSNSSQLCTDEESCFDLTVVAGNSPDGQKLIACTQNERLVLNDSSFDGDSDTNPSVEGNDTCELYYDAASDDGFQIDDDLLLDMDFLDNPENLGETDLDDFDWFNKYITLDAFDEKLHQDEIFDSLSLQNLDVESSHAHVLEIKKENLMAKKENLMAVASSEEGADVPCTSSKCEKITEDKIGNISLKRKAENVCSSQGGKTEFDDKIGEFSGEPAVPGDGYGYGFGKSLAKRFHNMLDVVAPPASASDDQYRLNNKLMGLSTGAALLPTPIRLEAGIVCLSNISVNSSPSTMKKVGYLRSCLLAYMKSSNNKATSSVVLRHLLYYVWILVCLFAVSFKAVISIRAK